jgi:murein DD-endopeptidase MepM/ murein hydrolase activator NlpD
MAKKKSSKKKKLTQKLRSKYKLVILNDETYEEKLTFRLSRMNVFIVTGTLTILLIVLTTLFIALTPLREYIPGYTDVSLYERLYRLQNLTDSLERVVDQRGQYMENIRNILQGGDTVVDMAQLAEVPDRDYDNIEITPSSEDSLLRDEFEGQGRNRLLFGGIDYSNGSQALSNYTFFMPLSGIITNHFNPSGKHYGVDIVAIDNEAVKATLDGVVTFAGWTLETGYTMIIQHHHNLLSVYQHNSILLKEQGAYVKAGDPVAIVGSSGKLSTGPHLHFEIWYDGVPVNPADFIAF